MHGEYVGATCGIDVTRRDVFKQITTMKEMQERKHEAKKSANTSRHAIANLLRESYRVLFEASPAVEAEMFGAAARLPVSIYTFSF